MGYIGEVGIAQEIKHGEITCGDAVEVVRGPENVVVVLSDGLGSGVKANILSNLTIKIAAKMISSDIALEDVVETVVQTLPICSERHVAYSTFSIIKLFGDGMVHLMDYDGCPALRIKKGIVRKVRTYEVVMAGRVINEAAFRLAEGEMLVIMSDGVTQAGLGLSTSAGIGTDGLMKALRSNIRADMTPQQLADHILDICRSYNYGEAGDDTTVAVLRLRQPRRVTVLTGAPQAQGDDAAMVRQFLQRPGTKVVCGGTTASILARETGRVIGFLPGQAGDTVPPMSKIGGVDLVTEGIITMGQALRLLEEGGHSQAPADGARLLLETLLESDEVHFIVGTQINPANQKGGQSLNLREVIVERWQGRLEALGKRVTVEKY